MTDQDQIVALAELEGWKGPFTQREWLREAGKEGEDVFAELAGTNPCGERDEVPDYLNDLSVVHRVKSKLTDTEYDSFIWELRCVCAEQRDGRVKTSMVPQRDEWRGLLEATARQLSEAILRATGRWKE